MSKHFKKFLLLWSGELISSIGGGLTSFGLTVYVFSRTGSAASTALIALLAFLPNLILGVPAGVLADRIDRRLLMMLGDGLSAIGLIYILICMLNGGAQLWQICLGVTVSSVFSSLMEPSYKATVSDLLTEEEYVKASGLVSLAGSARYLISPFLAGLILAVSDIKLLLIIDIFTFVITVITTAVVRHGMTQKKDIREASFAEDLRGGWKAVTGNKGLITLVAIVTWMAFCMGAMQILSEPMILDFEGSKTLGIVETVCASGMLVTSILLGAKGMKKGIVRALCLSLTIAGICMFGFGVRENLIIIGISGFIFFMMIPIANSSLDYLVRTNISNELQGRAWGVIGFISQLGYVISYGVSGIIADKIAKVSGISVGRGSATVIMVSGVLLTLSAVLLYWLKNVRALERVK